MDKNRLLPVQGIATLAGLNTAYCLQKIQAGEIGPAWVWSGTDLKPYERGESTRELYMWEQDILSYIRARPNNQYVLYPHGEAHDDPGNDAGMPIPFSIAAERLGLTYNQLRGVAQRGEIDRWVFTQSGVNMRKYRPDEEEEASSGRRPTSGRSAYVFERDIEAYRQVRQQEQPKRHHELTPEEEAQARAIAEQQIATLGHVVISELMESMQKPISNTYFRRGMHELAKREGWIARERKRERK